MEPAATDAISLSSARLDAVLVRRDGEWIVGAFAVERGPEALRGSSLRAAGVVPAAEAGRYYALELRHTPHPQYGDQYRILRARPALPLTREGLRTYMKYHIKGIGPKRAGALIDAFGTDLPAVLEGDAAVLAIVRRVPGIPEKTVRALVNEWRAVRDQAELAVALHGAGCSPAQVARMHDRFGLDLARVATAEPYRLMAVRGVGFAQADAVARHFGCEADSPLRCRAALAEILERETRRGHCWTPWEDACSQAATLIDLDAARVAATARAGVPDDEPLLFRDALDRTWLPRLHRAHRVLVRQLAARRAAAPPAPEVHTRIPPVDGLTLTPEQEAAVDGVLGHAIAILTGGPGTGKTTTVRSIIGAFEARYVRPRILLAAPTGKAARRMTESCGRPATTVHRLLEWGGEGPGRHGDRPLAADLVIVDEASMLDQELAAHLLAAVPGPCRLVLVGDVDQLPPVGPGQFLADCIEAGLPAWRLSVVQRQGRASLIVRAAKVIRHGRQPVFGENREADLYLIEGLGPTQMRDRILRFLRTDIPERRGIPTADIRVLIPQYRGVCGIEAVNRHLQEALNPPAPGKGEIPLGKDRRARVGDRLLWLSNQPRLGLVNGSEVELLDVVGEGDRRRVQLVDDDGVLHELPPHQLDVTLAYAMSVHKSQGSEYPACLVVLDPAAGPLLNRRLVYTAITRAKRLCVVLGQSRTLARAIANDHDDRRRTGLTEDLEGFPASAPGPGDIPDGPPTIPA